MKFRRWCVVSATVALFPYAIFAPCPAACPFGWSNFAAFALGIWLPLTASTSALAFRTRNYLSATGHILIPAAALHLLYIGIMLSPLLSGPPLSTLGDEEDIRSFTWGWFGHLLFLFALLFSVFLSARRRQQRIMQLRVGTIKVRHELA